MYSIVHLSVWLRCRPMNFYRWSMEVVSSQLVVEDPRSADVIKILEEACRDRWLLRALVLKRPAIMHRQRAENLLIRFPAVTEGLEHLIHQECLEPMIHRWLQSGNLKYVSELDSLMSKSLYK